MADHVSVALLMALMMTLTQTPGGRGTGGGGVSPPPGLDGATGFVVGAPSVADPVEAEYERLLAFDDEAQEEMDRWIREADALGASADNIGLQQKIDNRIGGVIRAYGEFLEKHPAHSRARIAYGSFLNDTGQESGAKEQWEKALALDPKNPAIYNNLAGLYGHQGPITNAFTFFEKAIELDPKEPVYYQNLATTVFLFRRDVMEHYAITNEQRVFDKALGLYRKAMELDPTNFILAADTAQTYYGIKPPRHDEALAAWGKAYDLASDELEREGVRIHLARIQIQAGRLGEARTNLNLITNANFQVVKERIEKNLETRLKGGKAEDLGNPEGEAGIPLERKRVERSRDGMAMPRWNDLLRAAQDEVRETLSELPPTVRRVASKVPVLYERRPGDALVADGLDADLLGLFVGDPMGEEGQGSSLPAQILLFLENLWEFVEGDPDAYAEEVQTTFLHELGHYLGLDEIDLEDRGLE